MRTEEITIRVDPEAARIYKASSEEERRKLDLLLSLRLRGFWHRRTEGSLADLEALMDKMSDEAQSRGLTPEVLQAILNERETA